MSPPPANSDTGDLTLAEESASISAWSVSRGYSSGRRRLALIVVALAFVMDLLDTTIVNIAVPSIQQNLHTSSAHVEWLIAGYALAFSLLLITGGRLGDTYGYKRLFVIGVVCFAAASLLCGVAGSANTLVAARVLQGGAAALMVPQVMALLQVLYQPHERIRVQALFGLMGGTSAAVGPVLGAFLIRSNLFGLGWRIIFLINLPVALLALAAGRRALPRGGSTHPLPPDLPGAAFLTVILFFVIYPLLEGSTLGWPFYLYVFLLLAAALLPVFLWYLRWRERRDGAPVLLPALFQERAFTIGLLTSFFFSIANSAYMLVFTLMLQLGLHFTVVRAGFYSMPFALGVMLSLAFLGRRFVPLLGRNMLAVGIAILATSIGVMSIVLPRVASRPDPIAVVLLLQLTAGVGLGFFLSAMSPIILSNVELRFAGLAAGVMNSSQQLCGALSVAVLGGLFFRHAGPSSTASMTRYTQAFHVVCTTEIVLLLCSAILSFQLPSKLLVFETPELH